MKFSHLLTLLFIGLKLTGYIDWNWFWVLSPYLFDFILYGLKYGLYLYVKKFYPSLLFKWELEKLIRNANKN